MARERGRKKKYCIGTVIRNLLAFILAALFEIGGCFAFWQWLRQGRSPLIAAIGVLSLVAFAVILTRVDAPFAGRAYAAYGGIYIAASLVWLMAIEGQRPTSSDVIGALAAIAGAMIIVSGALRG
jgi:small multidrug resistance family-3 protein